MAEQVEGAAHNQASTKETSVHQPGHNPLTTKAPCGTLAPRHVQRLPRGTEKCRKHELTAVASGTPSIQKQTGFLPGTKPEVMSGS